MLMATLNQSSFTATECGYSNLVDSKLTNVNPLSLSNQDDQEKPNIKFFIHQSLFLKGSYWL